MLHVCRSEYFNSVVTANFVAVCCRYANDLPQLDNGKQVPPTGWKCEKCDLAENLWLNLTDGSILCGRKNWVGSGGNNHALEHYSETRFPLAVKLGTITPDGAGFVTACHKLLFISVDGYGHFLCPP